MTTADERVERVDCMVKRSEMEEVCCTDVAKGWLFTRGQTSNPNRAWKKADVLKINSDDDDDNDDLIAWFDRCVMVMRN